MQLVCLENTNVSSFFAEHVRESTRHLIKFERYLGWYFKGKKVEQGRSRI